MAFTGGMFVLFTAGIVVSASYRAGHALGALRRDVKLNKTQLAALNAELTKTRALLIRGGLLAMGAMGLASLFGKTVDKAMDLQVALTNIHRLTQASKKEMGGYLDLLLKASERTKYSTADVLDIAAQLYTTIPGLSAGKRGGFANVTAVTPLASEIATLFEMLPGKKYPRAKTIEALGNLVNINVPVAQMTPERIRKEFELAAATFIMAPFRKPEQLYRSMGYMSGATIQGPPIEKYAFITSLMTQGLLAGRSAGLPGRAMEEGLKIMFGRVEGTKGGGGGSRFGISELFGMGRSGGGGTSREQVVQKALGLDVYREAIEKGVPFSIRDMLVTMRERALAMSLTEWTKLMNTLTRQARRVFAGLHEPTSNIVTIFDLISERIKGMPSVQDFITAQLHTARGSTNMLISNIEDLASVVGLALLPGIGWFNKLLGDSAMSLARYIVAHREGASAIISFAAIATAAGAMIGGFKLGQAAKGFLGFKLPVEAVAGVAAGAAGTAAYGNIGAIASKLGPRALMAGAGRLAVGALPYVGTAIMAMMTYQLLAGGIGGLFRGAKKMLGFDVTDPGADAFDKISNWSPELAKKMSGFGLSNQAAMGEYTKLMQGEMGLPGAAGVMPGSTGGRFGTGTLGGIGRAVAMDRFGLHDFSQGMRSAGRSAFDLADALEKARRSTIEVNQRLGLTTPAGFVGPPNLGPYYMPFMPGPMPPSGGIAARSRGMRAGHAFHIGTYKRGQTDWDPTGMMPWLLQGGMDVATWGDRQRIQLIESFIKTVDENRAYYQYREQARLIRESGTLSALGPAHGASGLHDIESYQKIFYGRAAMDAISAHSTSTLTRRERDNQRRVSQGGTASVLTAPSTQGIKGR